MYSRGTTQTPKSIQSTTTRNKRRGQIARTLLCLLPPHWPCVRTYATRLSLQLLLSQLELLVADRQRELPTCCSRGEEEEDRGGEMADGLGVKAAPFTYVAHALAAAAAVMVLVWCIHFRGGLAFEATNKNLIFNVHPVLMLIGYIILGSEAIMIYKIFPRWNHNTAKVTHLTLHAIAIVLGAVGIYCAFKFHNESGIANLYSLHSWLGIGAISLYGIQWIFGFVVFFFPGADPNARRGALPWHVVFGIFVYILTLATAELGFLEKMTFLQSSGLDKYGAEAFLVNFTALVVVLFGAAVVVAAVSPAARVEEPEGYAPIPVNP